MRGGLILYEGGGGCNQARVLKDNINFVSKIDRAQGDAKACRQFSGKMAQLLTETSQLTEGEVVGEDCPPSVLLAL